MIGPPDGLLRAASAPTGAADAPALPAALARLDQAAGGPHPPLPALLHRARLDPVRRQAAVDGLLADPWHLAALLLKGLRPRRLEGARSITEGETVFEVGRTRSPTTGGLPPPPASRAGRISSGALHEVGSGRRIHRLRPRRPFAGRTAAPSGRRPVASFTADDTYHRADVYAEVAAQYPHADVVLPPRSGAVPGDTRTDDGRQVTEATTAADAPNRMPGLGRPEHVRVA